MNCLGWYHFHLLQQMNKSMLAQYPKGDAVETLWDKHPNTAILSLLNTGPQLVQEISSVFTNLLNPSLILKNGDIFISGRWVDDNRYQNMFWLNNATSYDHSLSLEKGLKSLNTFQFNTSVVPHGKIYGEDPRLFLMNDGRMFVTICHRFPRKIPELQMAYSELIPRNNRIEVGPLIDIKYKEFPTMDQKNWTPFEYNNEMLFIANVQPHRIVGTSLKHNWEGYPKGFDPLKIIPPGEKFSDGLSKVSVGTTVCLSNITNFNWKHGDIRGGSSPILIDNNTFLSFFHSSNDVPMTGKVLKTYVFGAYIFNAKPPFNIKAMSPEPILHESMYSGPWSKMHGSFYHIDYVSFPMSFVIENGVILLMYGFQDKDAWVAKIQLKGLLSSLKEVKTTVDMNTYKKSVINHQKGNLLETVL
jgi:predicted GH43/DUF377 family glycosyl hydrolase